MQRIFKNHPIYGFVIVLIITIGVSCFGFLTLKARDNADDLASQTSSVLTQIDEVMLGLVNMETGLRGYLLTGNSQLLDHYDQGKSQYETAMQQLRRLTHDNASLVSRWATVSELEQQWDSTWAVKGIQIRQDVDAGRVSSDALSSHVIAERDETLMDAIRNQLSTGKQEETDLLVRQLQEGQQANYLAYDIMTIGMIVSLGLGLITGAFLNRSNIEKARQIQLQHLLFEEREKERHQLARDLHDGPIQELLSTMFSIQDVLFEDIPPGAAERLQGIKTSLQTIMGELRASTMELRSPTLAKFGVRKAIMTDLDNFRQAHPEMQVHFICDEQEDPLPALRQAALFRVYQEAMRNIVRHARASEAQIRYQISDKAVVLRIRDNGAGFNLPEDWLALAQEGHFGLAGIRERTEAIGARLDIHSKPKEGTLIQVTVPLENTNE